MGAFSEGLFDICFCAFGEIFGCRIVLVNCFFLELLVGSCDLFIELEGSRLFLILLSGVVIDFRAIFDLLFA